MSQNCWEIKQCGRIPHGKHADLGICPAYTASEYNGVNHGKNAGRICWYVSGTFCHGEVQGTYAHKKLSCITCDVFKQVRKEEGDEFLVTVSEPKIVV